ncbi:hypothetical protein [Streptomyces sp. NPDC059564]|uniref:hypothetical protein n=1 Tax=Streptomyces sp. NPDC059564 TaxID=3346865 RepID=UPI00367C2ED8
MSVRLEGGAQPVAQASRKSVRCAGPGVTKAALLNVVPSPLGDLADLTVDLGNEPDSYASTIGHTGTLVALDLIAGALAGRDGDSWDSIAERTTAVHRRPTEVVAGPRERGARCVASDGVAAGASRASAEEGVGGQHPAPRPRRRPRDRTGPLARRDRPPHAPDHHRRRGRRREPLHRPAPAADPAAGAAPVG